MVNYSAFARGVGSASSSAASAAKSLDPAMFKNLNVDAIKNIDAKSLASMSSKLPDDQLKRIGTSLNPQQLGDLLKNLDDIQVRRLTNNIDPGKLSDILKNLDPATMKRVTKNTDPGKLAQSLKLIKDPAVLKRITDTMDPGVLKKITDLDPTAFKQVTSVDLKQLANRVSNAANKAPKRGRQIAKNAPTDLLDSADPIGDGAKHSGLSRTEFEDAAKNTGDMVKNSPPATEAASKLGFFKKMGGDVKKFVSKNWMVIGGCVFLLCLAYDTSNPFEALDGAAKDAGTTVRGLKDAAQDVGGGLGDLLKMISGIPKFLAANSGAFLACCIVIIILMITFSTMK